MMVILIPLTGGCLALLAGRFGIGIASLAAGLTAGAATLTALAVAKQGTLVYALGGWSAPLGITLRADGLSVAMLLMSAAVLLTVILYSSAYQHAHPSEWKPGEGFWALVMLLWGALNALFLSADIFNLYISLELLTLLAVALTILDGEEHALHAAMRYLLAGFVASTFYLLGVAMLYAEYGRLDLGGLGTLVGPHSATSLAAALITASLALKSALFPLHFWLPRAHASAPAPVSAILSSLVVTAAFYLFIRLWTTAFASIAVPAIGQLFGVLGAIAIVWGSLQALRQQRLKVMIAYSTVAQVGYLFLAVPIIIAALTSSDGQIWGSQAWNGVIYHAVSHGLAKAAMFLAAGNIVLALGSDRIVGISGIARRLPVTTYAFGIAGMTLIGLPPSGGFVAKWLLLSAAFNSGQWWWAVVLVAGGILTAGYVFLVLGQELSYADADSEAELGAVPSMMEYAAMTLALVALVLGVRVTEPLAILGIGFPLGGN